MAWTVSPFFQLTDGVGWYLSQEIQASGSVELRGNNLGGKVKLGDFKMTLKWSKIGNLKMFLIQVNSLLLLEAVFYDFSFSIFL